MSAPELLPCPFCGGPAELWQAQDNRPAWIACMGRCAVLISKEHATNEYAIKTWNTRAILSDPRVKAAIKALERIVCGNPTCESATHALDFSVSNARAAIAALKGGQDADGLPLQPDVD